ncbi:RNA-guided endonuclease InsQ/TnpB family protein [Gloeobacter kilaueensis]|uniref:Transposase n=1 Tax=Gloeobacter kilaueensis (strain ATCC BAA-2537 / CCAP 1431/1 / ULC 316 / JS1) TaxID=1183438 RepID=U5QJE6_GLOK1|nr:RNA-guided endonuclease TnpB family protein [Gloeobacter kilaueensis]AGY59036.1 transposase [Gloeobacter kilaueensis JS1]
MERAYRYRFYPTPEQEQLLRRTLGCVRLVFNKALAFRTDAWYQRKEKVDYLATSSLLTTWKQQEDLFFLNAVSSVPLQQCLRHLQKAFSNFWAGRARYPNFKKKRHGGAAEFTRSAFRYKDGQLFLAKCDAPLAIVWSRPLPEAVQPSTVTVKLDAAGRWHVSLLVDDQTVEPLEPNQKAIGLDVGITALVTTSTGEKVTNPRHYEHYYKRLRKAQRDLARKSSREPGQKSSRNREKARRKVARIQARIADSRRDFLHKLTTAIVRENQTVVVEDLAVRNMVRNRHLAHSISDAGWGELVRQLEYKCQWYGRTLVKVDRFFPSSKRCSSCGYILSVMPLSVRGWICPGCGTVHDRDINAAKNLLACGLASAAVGHTVEACGANIRPGGHRAEGQLHRSRNSKS